MVAFSEWEFRECLLCARHSAGCSIFLYVFIAIPWGRYFIPILWMWSLRLGRWFGLSSTAQWVKVWLQRLCFTLLSVILSKRLDFDLWGIQLFPFLFSLGFSGLPIWVWGYSCALPVISLIKCQLKTSI